MSDGGNDRNALVIADFRVNGGIVGGDRPGRPILLLTSKGRITGKKRTTPVLYLFSGSHYYVFATHGGSPEDPDWYQNMMAARSTIVEVPGETFIATPALVTGAEREQLYAMQAELFPQFLDYQANTSRIIPVVALEPMR